MKNRIKKFNKDNPDIKKILKDIEEKQKKIFDDRRSRLYEANIGKIPTKDDGTFDSERIDIVDINNLHKLFDLEKKRADFNKEDIKTLMGLMPSLIACKNSYPLPSDFALFLGERIGEIPTDRHIDKHHKKIGDLKTNAIESIELTEALIKAMLTIQDEEIKALIIKDLLQGLSFLETERDGIEIDEGLDYEEGRREEYKKALEYCQRYGVDIRLIDKAFDLWDEHFKQTKPILDKLKNEAKDEK